MSRGSDAVAVRGGNAEKGGKLGYSVGIDLNYDPNDEYRKPGYAQGPKGNVSSHRDGYKGGFASGHVGRARAVDKNGLSAEAAGPRGYVGSGQNKDGVFAGAEGGVGEAEAHAGYVGVGVQGPSAGYGFEAGKKGVNASAGANLAAGKVDVGPVKVGVGVGVKGVLRADSGGAGAIVPGVGGMVVAKDGLEVGVGPLSFKLGW